MLHAVALLHVGMLSNRLTYRHTNNSRDSTFLMPKILVTSQMELHHNRGAKYS